MCKQPNGKKKCIKSYTVDKREFELITNPEKCRELNRLLGVEDEDEEDEDEGEQVG
jgi:hypothetical protein